MKVRKLRERRRVPLRIGDIWIYIGPATQHRIVALAPRPTFQKPWSQAVTLDDGRTITEATLRGAYKRKQEYQVFAREMDEKFARARAEFFDEKVPTAKIYSFPRRT